MKHWLSFPSVQITLCTVCYGLLGYRLADYAWGRMLFVFLAPVYGAAIARPVINLAANFAMPCGKLNARLLAITSRGHGWLRWM